MWCACCRADVAAEMSSDHRRFSCTRCGTELGQAIGSSGRLNTPRVADSERDARELLARWSALAVLEPLQHGTVSEPASSPIGPTSASTVRLETAPPMSPTIIDESPDEPVRVADIERKRRRKRHPRPLPTNDVVSTPPSSRQFSWSQLAGHLSAYGGVGLLSIGMTLVVWSYFGGPAAYAPTGWLFTTVGQMLLYLGVVTLVASGLEQTTEAVSHQMRLMGDKLERLEAASKRPRSVTPRLRDAA